MIKKIFSALVVVLFATSVMAQSGFTCNDPILVDSNYVGTVPAEGEYWYTAGTYDLPLHVFFRPLSDACTISPEISVDFTCVPGYYADPKLDSVINTVADFGIELPIEFMCERLEVDGKYVYDLSIDKRYREQLAECGITYNVPAYVKVYFPEAGDVILRPDTAFSACVDNAEKVFLGDTIDVLPNDSDRVFVMPYPEWKNDSIRFVWTGKDGVRIWLAAQECSFTPVETSAFVWDYYDITSSEPKKLYSNQMEQAITNNPGGGMFYSKILSTSAGKLVVEKIPANPPAGGALLLEYDKPIVVAAHDSTTIYAFPKKWNKATKFVSASAEIDMLFSNSHLFDNSQSGVFATTYYNSKYDDSGVHLTSLDMQSMTKNAIDNFIYVRIYAEMPTTITPMQWVISECMDKSYAISANVPTALYTSSKNNYYRLNYSEYEGYDINIDWTGRSRLYIYMGDTCVFSMSTSDSHVFADKQFAKAGTATITADVVNSWKEYVDEEGAIYVRVNPYISGALTFMTDKPEPSTSPCVLGSTELKLNSVITLDLSSVHTIYRINYAEWQAVGATLAWEGTSPLHTFLAGTCTFPVAPHNRYVLDYEAVLPAGEKVMAADWLARMAQYVDEDGYLYIRFLTEFEGELTVK